MRIESLSRKPIGDVGVELGFCIHLHWDEVLLVPKSQMRTQDLTRLYPLCVSLGASVKSDDIPSKGLIVQTNESVVENHAVLHGSALLLVLMQSDQLLSPSIILHND